MCLRQPFQLLTSSPVPVKDNTCNKNENETFAANSEKTKQKTTTTTEFQLLRNNERKTDTNKQSNKTLGGYKGLREHFTTAPGKTALRMVLYCTLY